jgi:hypothetical protein
LEKSKKIMVQVKVEKLPVQNNLQQISLNDAEMITGSGPLSWTGAAVGGITGGIGGAVSHPVAEGYKHLTTGKSNFSLPNWGASIVGGASGGAATGSGVGKWLEGGPNP